jgi:hypothetical protein
LADEKITIGFIVDLQAFLNSCRVGGYTFGPHWRLVAIDFLQAQDDGHPDVYVSAPQDFASEVVAEKQSVRSFFGFGGSRVRKLYDPKVEALILHHAPRAVTLGIIGQTFDDDECCGRCGSEGHKKSFQNCVQAYTNGLLLVDGVCTNCLADGAAELYSFRRKFFSIIFQFFAPFFLFRQTFANPLF